MELDDLRYWYIGTHAWKDVGEDPDLDIMVVQVGSKLWFYNTSFDEPSDAFFQGTPFEIDLSTFAAPGRSAEDVARSGVETASAKGRLFVVGEMINPFYITFTPAAWPLGTLTTTTINIRIRDMDKQDTTTPLATRPTVLSDELKYDLYNQGWGYDKVVGNDSERYGQEVERDQIALEYYFFSTDHYPPRTKPWWMGKRMPIDPGEAGWEVFDPNGVYDPTDGGNTLAALGHFVLDYFRKDRATASGILELPIEDDFTRPTTVAFFAGRIFYGHKGSILFSQVIEDDLSVVGECFQEADPTAEEISDLIQTDGGIIFVQGAGSMLKMIAKDNSMLLFCTNGVWAVGGGTPGDGFNATGYSVRKVTSIGALSPRTIFQFEGVPTFWGEEGIFVLENANGGGPENFTVTNICDEKIQTFYDAINPLAKKNAVGKYDKVRKRLVWLFLGNTDADFLSASDPGYTSELNRFFYDRVLNFDLKHQAFFPYTFASDSNNNAVNPGVVVGLFNWNQEQVFTSIETVTDNAGDVVVDSLGDDVTVTINQFIAADLLDTDIRYLVKIRDMSGLDEECVILFADMDSEYFMDWVDGPNFDIDLIFEGSLVANTYMSQMKTYWAAIEDNLYQMQAPYLYAYMDMTPQRAPYHENESLDPLVDSSRLFVETRWDWRTFTNNANTNCYVHDNNALTSRRRWKPFGRGRVLSLNFYEDSIGKDWILTGWGLQMGKNTGA